MRQLLVGAGDTSWEVSISIINSDTPNIVAQTESGSETIGNGITIDDRNGIGREGQLEECMGDGSSNEPRVEAIAVLDAGIGREEAVSAIARIQEALWGLDGSMRLIAARRGANPREDWLYLTPSSKQKRRSCGDAPTEVDVAGWLKVRYGHEDLQAWDGSATVGDPDPSHVGSGLPEVTWKR